MDKYDRLMQEIVAYLQGTWLAKAPDNNYRFHDRGPISGSSEAEIEEAEQHVGKKLPAALKAWYRVAGKVPPYLNDHDADYSLDDLLRTQETVVDMMEEATYDWRPKKEYLPFSHRLGEQFMFVDVTGKDANDPPVFLYWEGTEEQVAVSLTCYIRELWLGWLDFNPQHQENLREIWRRTKTRDEELLRIQLVRALRSDAYQFRKQLIEKIHQEDLAHDEITGPRQFQERWLEAFSKSEVWQKMQSEGLRMPYGWITPPA